MESSRVARRRGARAGLGMVIAGCALAAAACESESETGSARVEARVEYPSSADEDQAGSLHLWVLREPDEPEVDGGRADRGAPGPRASTTCADLVGDVLDPYDEPLEVLADRVFLLPGDGELAADDLVPGDALVYVEVVDYVGETILAGCAPVTAGAGDPVTVQLGKPGTFDCGDASVDDGAPCDDGMLCTVGETCQDGACGGGRPRECEYVTDACTGAVCTEEAGCQPMPVPDGTSCDDALVCTTGDVCMDGACVGAERDCSEEIGQCLVATCDETFGCQASTQVPDGTSCDDGQFCVVTDECSFGTCAGTQSRDCSAVEDQCNSSRCDEVLDECQAVPLTNFTCDDGDACTEIDRCSAEGACESCGGTDCNDDQFGVNPDGVESTAEGNCGDTFDNDCDGNTDTDDPDC